MLVAALALSAASAALCSRSWMYCFWRSPASCGQSTAKSGSARTTYETCAAQCDSGPASSACRRCRRPRSAASSSGGAEGPGRRGSFDPTAARSSWDAGRSTSMAQQDVCWCWAATTEAQEAPSLRQWDGAAVAGRRASRAGFDLGSHRSRGARLDMHAALELRMPPTHDPPFCHASCMPHA